jgi:hypothetical protein
MRRSAPQKICQWLITLAHDHVLMLLDILIILELATFGRQTTLKNINFYYVKY